MKKIKYKIILYKGNIGDFATEWWTQEDWDKHNKYIEDLKSKGEYMQPFEIELEVNSNPLYDDFDNRIYPKTPTESYRMDFLNMNKDGR